VDERVLEEILGELAERVLALAGEALPEPFGGGSVRHGAKATRRPRFRLSLTLRLRVSTGEIRAKPAYFLQAGVKQARNEADAEGKFRPSVALLRVVAPTHWFSFAFVTSTT
jgi:hypothetical protein